jgi:hypothetical protein
VRTYSNITGVPNAMLQNMYALLTSDGSAPHQGCALTMQMRVVEFVANHGNVELWPYLTTLNGSDGEKYELFWEEGGRYLSELETNASDNRHGQERTLQLPLSVSDFTRQVIARLHTAGKADAPIPCASWVSFQFHPSHPTYGIATRYTSRWPIKMKVNLVS